MKILHSKFNNILKNALLNTTNAYLIAHTPFKGRDKYWIDDLDDSGPNHSSINLMEVR